MAAVLNASKRRVIGTKRRLTKSHGARESLSLSHSEKTQKVIFFKLKFDDLSSLVAATNQATNFSDDDDDDDGNDNDNDDDDDDDDDNDDDDDDDNNDDDDDDQASRAAATTLVTLIVTTTTAKAISGRSNPRKTSV